MSSTHKQTKPNEKHPQFGHLPLSTSGPLECALVGSALCNSPHFNKGAGFTAEERRAFKLTGLLPQNIQSLDQQVKRAYQQYSTRQDDLAKNTFMTSMKNQNEVLFYRVSNNILRNGSNFCWSLLIPREPLTGLLQRRSSDYVAL
jgi:malate dehydrogenase (oxaloacetate-decarboxylating)